MRRALPALLLSAVLAGCGGSSYDEIVVVATTAPVGALAREVAGDEAAVVTIVPAGAEPHGYEPRPRDLEGLTEAVLVLRSGGEVDEWLADTLASVGKDVPVVDLLGVVGGGEDPHWWLDPRNAMRAVTRIAALMQDKGGSSVAFKARAQAYNRRLATLDAELEECLGRLRPQERKLVTTHDSLGHFAERYGLVVLGAVLPSLSAQGQASAGETARLVATLERERVKAIFAERNVAAKVERAIADEAGVKLGGELVTDSLAPGQSYEQAMRSNAAAIADGLSGGRVRCSTG